MKTSFFALALCGSFAFGISTTGITAPINSLQRLNEINSGFDYDNTEDTFAHGHDGGGHIGGGHDGGGHIGGGHDGGGHHGGHDGGHSGGGHHGGGHSGGGDFGGNGGGDNGGSGGSSGGSSGGNGHSWLCRAKDREGYRYTGESAGKATAISRALSSCRSKSSEPKTCISMNCVYN